MKIYPFKIPKAPNQNIIVQIDESPLFYGRLHQHEEIQISQIVSGSGKLIVGDSIHSFKPGDLFVIGGGLPHLFKSEKSNADSKMISVFFSRNAFGDTFFENQEMATLKSFFDHSKSGFRVLAPNRSFDKEIKSMIDGGKFSKFISLLNVLKGISTSKKIGLSSFVHQKEISKDHGERLGSVFDHVMKNFDQKIRLENVSALIHMTPNAFCRFFKQRTNKTFFKFVAEIRIEHACQLLMKNSDLSIAEAANLSGFNSISNFNRKFREIKGENPSRYLQQLR